MTSQIFFCHQLRTQSSCDSADGLPLFILGSYLTYIKLSTAIKRNESMAKSLQKALLQPQRSDEDGKRSPRPQDLIRLYDIILQVLLREKTPPALQSNQRALGYRRALEKYSTASELP